MSFTYFNTIPFKDLIEKRKFDSKKGIRNSSRYFAHSPLDGKDREYELLSSHLEKTANKFMKLVNLQGLDQIVDNHIEKLLSHEDITEKQDFYEFIKLLFFEAIHLHDIGKINENFQRDKMGKLDEFEKQNNSLGSNHSILSVFLFYSYMFEKLRKLKSDIEQGFAFVLVLLFSVSIRKHHSSELSDPFFYFEKQIYDLKTNFFSSIKVGKLNKYLEEMFIEFNEYFHKEIFFDSKLNENYKKPFLDIFTNGIDSFPLYSLIKLNSSLLTLSDYLATSEYMWDEDINIRGIITKELRQKISTEFYSTKTYNERLLKEGYKSFDDLRECSEENINELRFKMVFEVKENLCKNIDTNLFFLEAPTGGGKTNMSFMAVCELLKQREELNKVFYVFPFTTLATQTRELIIETFDLKSDEFIELHSKSGFKEKEESDGEYGRKKLNFIDYQFVNYPITLLTHIKFFDILKSNKKNDNYLYHKLANSIVIIDEIQAYPPQHWDKIYYFMKNLSEMFNIVFIIMSATLPKIDELKITKRLDFSKFIHLNKNKESYFQNPNFAKRVEFDLSLINRDSKNSFEEIKERMFNESEEYANNNSGKCWVLVEFIFKNSASKFYDNIKERAESLGYELKMLSGTILEPVRKKIIGELKERSKKKDSSKIILVSTQVVEAGVDLDFDLGFKDTSILDSDEQLAGRINRNASKKGCKVFLFNYNDEYHVYGSDYRYKIQSQNLDIKNYETILKDKDFDSFYKTTFNYIDKLNKSESRYGFFDYEDSLRKLNYSKVHKDFKLIDQETLSVFVNVKYDLAKYPIRNTLDLAKDGELYGKDVFDKYCSIIENNDQDFIEKKISLVEIIELMSNFIFSIFKSSKIVERLRFFSIEEKYGFWYIDDLKNSSGNFIYTLKGGLNEKEMDDVQFI